MQQSEKPEAARPEKQWLRSFARAERLIAKREFGELESLLASPEFDAVPQENIARLFEWRIGNGDTSAVYYLAMSGRVDFMRRTESGRSFEEEACQAPEHTVDAMLRRIKAGREQQVAQKAPVAPSASRKMRGGQTVRAARNG